MDVKAKEAMLLCTDKMCEQRVREGERRNTCFVFCVDACKTLDKVTDNAGPDPSSSVCQLH